MIVNSVSQRRKLTVQERKLTVQGHTDGNGWARQRVSFSSVGSVKVSICGLNTYSGLTNGVWGLGSLRLRPCPNRTAASQRSWVRMPQEQYGGVCRTQSRDRGPRTSP